MLILKTEGSGSRESRLLPRLRLAGHMVGLLEITLFLTIINTVDHVHMGPRTLSTPPPGPICTASHELQRASALSDDRGPGSVKQGEETRRIFSIFGLVKVQASGGALDNNATFSHVCTTAPTYQDTHLGLLRDFSWHFHKAPTRDEGLWTSGIIMKASVSLRYSASDDFSVKVIV